MDNSNLKIVKRHNGNNTGIIQKVHMYKDIANNAMKDALEFDKKIIESNDTYIDKLRLANSTEYEILKINMEKAESSEEREAIRKRMAEMDKEHYTKDTENKAFYRQQQESHRNYNLKILGSVAVVSGLVYKFRKPILEAGKKLIKRI